MTINLADNSPRISYAVAQGATQTSFAVPFEFFASADLNVYVDGTLKTLTTHYTVSGGDGSTGTVTISVTGATGGSTVVITRDVALERTSDFPSSGPFQIGALNTELDRLTAIAADLDDKAGRALQVTDYDVATGLTLPEVNDRKGKTLAFNASSGAVEAGPTISDVQTVSAAAADIQTLAHIEDGTDATDAIQTVAGIASNVSTVSGVSSAVSTVAGISSNVTAVAGDATDIGVVAGKAAEIGRLGTAQAVADLDILATTDAVSDMNTLAAISSNISTVAGISANVTSVAGVASLITSDFVADLNTLATSDIVSDLNTLATADIVSDLNTLATSDIVSDLNTLATADIVSDLNTLATTDIVSDLNTLATTDIVTDLNLLATSAIVEDLNLLATSTVIADMATLAGAGANPNISSLGVSGTVTAGGLTVDTNTLHVDATNNRVGIGTSSPSYALDVDGEIRIKTNTNGLIMQTSTSSDVNVLRITGGNNVVLRDSTNSDALTINSSGNVGIGTSSPSQQLTLANSSSSKIQIKGHSASNGFFLGMDSATAVQLWNAENGFMRFATNDSERMRIDSSGNVGIGTSSPNDKLTISGSAAYMTIDRSDGEAGVTFRYNGDNTKRADIATQTNGDLRFRTNLSEAMRIDSSGNLLVGKTTQGLTNAGFEVAQSGQASITQSGASALRLNRLSSDGELLQFRKDGSTVGSIGTSSSRLHIENGDTGLRIAGDLDQIFPCGSGGGDRDAAIDLGSTGVRFKDLYLSGTAYVDTAIEIHAGNSLKLQNVAGNGFATIQNAGAGTNTDLGFSTAGSERMRIDSSGNVGIGTSSPSEELSTVGNVNIGNNDSSNPASYLRFGATQYGAADIRPSDEGGHKVGLDFYTDGTGDTTIDPTFAMRIDSSGNVGIGNSSPNTKLDIIGSSTNGSGVVDTLRLRNTGTSLNDGPRLQFTSGTSTSGAAIGSQGKALNSADLLFYTGGNTERMRLDASGNLGIGITPTVRLHVYGTAGNYNSIFRNGSDSGQGVGFQRADGTHVGSITWASTTVSFNTSSDHRLKENVVDLTGATTRLKQLEPKRFNFIADADTTVDGFLAHEVQSVVPEAIHGTKDAVDADGNPVYQGIDQSKLVPLLVATIKELEARITALENA
jgi:hypothetical protein